MNPAACAARTTVTASDAVRTGERRTPRCAGPIRTEQSTSIATRRGVPAGSPRQRLSGTCSSECAISSIETSRKVSTFADFTNRAGRYMSHTQASPIDTS